MFVKQLSEFSAERYYLISEIDQKSAMYFVRDHGDHRPELEGDIILTVIYALWDVSKNETHDNVINRITKTYDQLQKLELLSKNMLIAVDALLESRQHWEICRPDIENVMQKLAKVCNDVVLIGVSDKVGSLPALQRCQELIESVHPGMYDYPIKICFSGFSQDDMLGHDPRLEPSGSNEVFQIACWPEEEAEAKLVNRVKEIDNTPDVVRAMQQENAIPDGLNRSNLLLLSFLVVIASLAWKIYL